jgi:hypothetical protein
MGMYGDGAEFLRRIYGAEFLRNFFGGISLENYFSKLFPPKIPIFPYLFPEEFSEEEINEKSTPFAEFSGFFLCVCGGGGEYKSIRNFGLFSKLVS